MKVALRHRINTAAAGLSTAIRPVGGRAAARAHTPNKPLELYEFEACPYCRKVREAISMLALPTLVYPCPKGGTRYRPTAIQLGGKRQFPYLVDPNSDVALYESDDIVAYLFKTYGDGKVPVSLSAGVLTDAQSFLAGMPRLGYGVRELPSTAPDRPLHLWAYESCPHCRLVRERLCVMELAYVVHPVPKGAKHERVDLLERGGQVLMPYLEDPNTGAKLYEAAQILAYLSRTYSAG